jgi:hypothetical protein
MSCSNCNQTKCNCSGPTRYNGPNVDCVGLTNGTPYDAVIQQLAEFMCNIEFEDGVGISEVIDNGDGTITFVFTDGNTTNVSINPNVVVQAGSGISVSSNTVGNTTTYTVSANPVCPMIVSIGDSTLVPRSIEATVTGGTAPYTYAWSMSDFSGDSGSTSSMIQLDATAYSYVVQPALNLTYPGNLFDVLGNDSGRIGLAKVTVTDANGCVATDTYLIIFTPAF